MDHSVKRVAVLGAGTMGAQIAAHLANVGISSLLLDLPSQDSDRNAVAASALQKLVKSKPPPFYVLERKDRIEIGNFEDHLHRVKECQWIIEAVVERLEVKQSLWARVEEHRVPGTIVSTNTSGISIGAIAQGRSEEFQRHWLGTHFFNPPRYMKLLELIPGRHTSLEVVERMVFVGEHLLGKGVVFAKDTPNFIANRIGTFFSMRALRLMEELDLSIETVDALTGPVIGLPKTAVFHLGDLVGVDVLTLVAGNLYRSLTEDPWRELFQPPHFIREMVSSGRLGRKSGAGFYRKEGSELLVLDRKSGEYRRQQEPSIPSLRSVRSEPDLVRRVTALLQADDQAASFLWPLLRDTFYYSAACLPEIADEYFQVDRAMKWGFNWQMGPFELWQKLGMKELAERAAGEGVDLPAWVQDLLDQGSRECYVSGPNHVLYFDLSKRQFQEMPEAKEKVNLTLLKERGALIDSSDEASLVDLGEGVACLEFHSKMNTVGPGTVEMAGRALERVEKEFLGLVIGNQGAHFCAGANLSIFVQAIQSQNWQQIESGVQAFQQMNQSFRRSPRPVVAAPFQQTLGGGTEICLGADAMVASAETYMGLVEVGVGLIPAGGGCKELLIRSQPSLGKAASHGELSDALKSVFHTIGRAKVSSSGEEARRLCFLRPEDSIEVHPDRLLYRAAQKVLTLVQEGYVAQAADRYIPVMGASGLAVLKVGIHLMLHAGFISEFDALVGQKLAFILSGGDLNHATQVPEQYLLDLEREAFLSLCGEEKTLQRILHTLKTGKPLRN